MHKCLKMFGVLESKKINPDVFCHGQKSQLILNT